MRNFQGCHKGQGATEYLVLLAVVLIVALVSVALLGFFPGMASDSQMTQSKTYWSSASPIAISETSARFSTGWGGNSLVYLRFRNNGAYPIRITKLLGGTNVSISSVYCYNNPAFCTPDGPKTMSDYYYLAPGEEKYLGGGGGLSIANAWLFVIAGDVPNSAVTNDYKLPAASVICQNSAAASGTLIVNNFGFEYIQYMEGQQITKRQVGVKPLLIKCGAPGG